MKHNILFVIIISILIIMFGSSNVYANSSWHWVTTSPMTILPFAIIITLLVETISISKINSINNTKKVFVIVSLANLLSFIAPYLERAYRFIPTSGRYAISGAFTKGPYYIVLIGYLLLTIIIELPIVYYFLRTGVLNKKKLIKVIIISNTVTTLIVAILERIICIGKW